jgi:hypothetical protein
MSEVPSSKPSYAIGPQGPRNWDVQVNNIPLVDLLAAYTKFHSQASERLEWLTISNAWLGVTYRYGIHPNASSDKPYDGIWKRERSGGGSVIVVYTQEPDSRQIYVGLLRQWRMLHNPEQPVLGVARGFAIEADRLHLPTRMEHKAVEEEIHLQTALTELGEEMFTGKISPAMFHRLGPPLNTNNADVDTSGEGEGIYIYALELPWTYLTRDAEDNLVLKEEFWADQGILEGIVKCQFRLLAEVLETLDDPDSPIAGCAITETAIARLTRYLQRNGHKII